MNTITAQQFDRFLRAAQTLLPDPSLWVPLEIYPDSLAECIIDAIWSERVRYANIQEIIGRYREARQAEGGDADTDGADQLAASFAVGLDNWMNRIGNRQRVYSRTQAPYKADVVHQAALTAQTVGIITTRQLGAVYSSNSQQLQDLRQGWLALPAQHSGLSWERLLLVAGIKTVPADPWLRQFASQAVGVELSSQDALGLVEAAARVMDVTGLRLRNAIWQYQTKLDRPADTRPAVRSGQSG
ncbi:MAG: hypothetical protein LBJ62_06735 [Bifidobacteriaceae bacterium]|jgi:hypothetical protein|nr:hypothetical protein [Bifidobacteriaceae bacterium]